MLTPQDIRYYITQNGKKPFYDWFFDLDSKTASIVYERLERIKTGYFGDYKNLGHGVFELRIHIGPGYRVYFGKRNREIILLLCAGDKNTQMKDIKKAKNYWEDCINDECR